MGWWEIHSENFFQAGGPSLENLLFIREKYPLSLHGVGLSLGSSSEVDEQHLTRLKKLIQIIDPFVVSEHLSWSKVGSFYLPDLLPIPYTEESLEIIVRNIEQVQDYLGREILIENPSSYLEFSISQMDEVDFLITLCHRTGAKILLDVNNIFVSCSNHGWNMKKYIDSVPPDLVREIHLAGHSAKFIMPDQKMLIDTHDTTVDEAVWALYGYAISKLGPKPTLLEWDAQIPSLDVLIKESRKALDYLPQEVMAIENT